MGRVKLTIKRLESGASRLSTYSKRKAGLLKKANELSVLCDVDIVVLMFSPSGKPVMWKGDNSTIEGILRRFSEISPQERVKRKLESFETLKRAFKKEGRHEIIVQEVLGSSYRTSEDLTDQANSLRTHVSEVQKRLSDWNNLEKMDNIELLEEMEAYMRNLLDQVQTQKEIIGKQQFLAQGCQYQVQNGMSQPFRLDAEVQHFSSLNNNDNQHTVVQEEITLLPKRGEERCNSFVDGSGYFGTDRAGIAIGQQNDILTEFLKTESLRKELIDLKTETLKNQLAKNGCFKNELLKAETSESKLMNIDFLSGEVMTNECFMIELTKSESVKNELIKVATLTNDLSKPGSLGNDLMRNEALRNQLIKIGSSRNELDGPESLRLRLCEQDCLPLYNFRIHPNEKFEPLQQMNLQQSIDHPDENFEPVQQVTLQQIMDLPNENFEQVQLQQSIDHLDENFEPVQLMTLQQNIDHPDKQFEPVPGLNLHHRSIDDFFDEGNFELPPGYGYPEQHYTVDGHIAREQHYSVEGHTTEEH